MPQFPHLSGCFLQAQFCPRDKRDKVLIISTRLILRVYELRSHGVDALDTVGIWRNQSRRASWRGLGQEREGCRTSVLGNYVSRRTGARLGMALRCARQGGKPQGHLPSGPISHHALLSRIASTEESIAMLQKLVPFILLEPLRAVPIPRRLE